MANGVASTTSASTQRNPLAAAPTPPPQHQQAQVNGTASTSNASSPPAANTVGPAASDSSTTPGLVYPALHLLPLNDTFVPKQISLSPPGSRVKIGRQTNAKTVPSATNGYFDSKVLSRMHAEVWSEDGKIYIKDVKSSNGTFINGDRLSPESAESDAFELHSEDVVEFGIDIVSDDNKTIVHHKVSTKVHLASNAEEAVALMKSLPALYRMHDSAFHRRPTKAGLTFDHVFNRLQTELSKSRETAGELGGLTTIMAEIHDTLGGGVPPPLPTFPQPVRGNGYSSQVSSKGTADPQTVAFLQAQLTDTQASLAGHADKVRGLESLLVDHQAIKHEITILRDTVQTTKRDVETFRTIALMNGLDGINGSREMSDGNADDSTSISSSSTMRNRLDAENIRTEENDALREQNIALFQRLDELTRELRDTAGLSLSLLAQQEAAASAVQVLEGRVAQLEQDLEEGNDRWENWKKQYETDWRRDQNERLADRQRLQAAVEDWETRGLHQRNGGSDASITAVVDELDGSREQERGAPRSIFPQKKSLSRESSETGISTPLNSASMDDSAQRVDSVERANKLPSNVGRGDGHRADTHLPPKTTQALAGEPFPAEERTKSISSLPIASSVGILIVGIAVWVMAHRD